MIKFLFIMKVDCIKYIDILNINFIVWWLMFYICNEINVNWLMIECRMNNMMIKNVFLRNIKLCY